MKFSVGILFFLLPLMIFGQNDSIWMKNKDLLVGELKTLSKSIITFSTTYSDKDFKIDFNEVSSFSTKNIYVVNLTNGSRHTGRVKSVAPGKLHVLYHKAVIREIDIKDIISLTEINEKFWKRFTGALDVGFNLSKGNNYSQLNLTGNIKYSSDKWDSKFSFNSLYSSQDNTEDIERKEYTLNGRRFIKRWYLEADLAYLSSTELGIKNRTNPGLGAGRNIATTSKLYWLAGAGLNYNIESYFDEAQDKESLELKFLTTFEMFDYENLSLYTHVAGYPSLSEKGRFRLDYNLVFKYDLPFDFYIKAEFTLNYDNQPATNGSSSDYVLSSGLGWELK